MVVHQVVVVVVVGGVGWGRHTCVHAPSSLLNWTYLPACLCLLACIAHNNRFVVYYKHIEGHSTAVKRPVLASDLM